ncbi:MAG TPA: hypothetical protein VJW76_16135 [Verrucomicrobiae bacterium]|nr:hypothetical protein [Verrucomicrobiae bacterium]
MNRKGNSIAIVSLILILPALLLLTAGILDAAVGVEAANRMLAAMTASTPFNLLVSPVIVLGGPLVALALNAWKVFHVSADVVNEEFVIALSVKRLSAHLCFVVTAAGLLLLLLLYGFVENFQIVAR